MAKCGCNPICTCRINDSACVDVTGLGTPTNPYQLHILVDGETVLCTGEGLQREIIHIDTNTVDIEGSGSLSSPLTMKVIRTPDANVPDPDGLGVPNLIKELPGVGEGLYVSCEDVQDCVGAAVSQLLAGNDCLIYDDTANAITLQICPELNGLECVPTGDPTCPAGGLGVIPSSDPSNGLVIGSDGRLWTPPFEIAAGPCLEPITQAGTPSDPFILDPQVAPELNGLECLPGQGLAVIPSSDPGNGLRFGADNRLYSDTCLNVIPSQIRIGEPGPCFESVGNGCDVPFTVIFRISDDACGGMCCRPDGLFVQRNTVPMPLNTWGLFSENWSTGVFNGTFNDTVVMAPRCINITNPSSCKTLLGDILFGGVVDLRKTSGNFVIQYQTSLNGPGGPWNTAVSAALLDPDPPSPQTMRVVSTLNGDESQAFELGPGASQQVCVRIVIDGFFLVNGQVANSDRSADVSGTWGQNVNTCP